MEELDLGATVRGLAPGQKLFGRFTLRRQIGRGGMGVVWLAHDERLEREVALKLLPEIVAQDERAIDDLRRETRRALELTHPHIVRIYDFWQDARTTAIAMEFVDGASLSKLALERPGKVFEPADLREWVRQLGDALTYAHTKARVVHRDLKPANLMVDQRGDLKITDFGISATLSDTATRVSKVAGTSGTPVYMSPQQMMGEKPAPTDDIYSLGATLYELLTGKPPFYTGNLLMQVQNKVPPAIAERRAELEVRGAAIPSEWEKTIAACLAKDPAQRPQSAGEVAARLQIGPAAHLGVGPPLVGVPVAPHQARHGADGSKVESRGSISDFRGQKSGVESRRSKDPPVGPDLVSGPARPSRINNPKSKIPLIAAAVVLAGLGWYFGIYAPEQRRIEAEQARVAQAKVEAERARLEEARSRAEAQRLETAERLKAEQAQLEAQRATNERLQAEVQRLAAERRPATSNASGGGALPAPPAPGAVGITIPGLTPAASAPAPAAPAPAAQTAAVPPARPINASMFLESEASARKKAVENWENECAKCHGADGKGLTRMGKKLVLRDLTDANIQSSLTDETIDRIITNGMTREGRITMNGFQGRLSSGEIRSLVAYIRSLAASR